MYSCPNCTKLSKVSPCKYGPGYVCENGHIFEKEPLPPLMAAQQQNAVDRAAPEDASATNETPGK